MATPQTYYALNARYEALRALVFRLVMSDAVDFSRPETQAVFDLVGDMSEAEAEAAIREHAATETA